MHERQNIGKVSMGNKLRRVLWNTVRVLLFRPFGTKVFRPWRLSVLRLFGARVDWSAEVYASAKIWAPWQLRMAAGSCLGPETIVYNQALVTLGQDACLSQYAYICTAGHAKGEVNNAKSGLLVAEVTIGDGAWIGTRAFIGMGVEVGAGSIVGACACVFKDVEPGTIFGGNPAVKIGYA